MLFYYLTQFFLPKLNFKLEIDPKACTFKNLGETPDKKIGHPYMC